MDLTWFNNARCYSLLPKTEVKLEIYGPFLYPASQRSRASKARRRLRKERGPSVQCWNQWGFHLVAMLKPKCPNCAFDPSTDPSTCQAKIPHAAKRGGEISMGCCTPWPYTTIWASWLVSQAPCKRSLQMTRPAITSVYPFILEPLHAPH